ncbi:YDG domain-containing protein [Halopseudomonas maritima]|uniref:YDG domain-containing protein n=1 Tax=Halopseudomonas maritima TaxID=2918528 RepID=UPI001EEA9443|nr:YDG domain-containing protein [Halopseudomonas maritima]UJJ30659.1 filamentous hemagglutinin N-terminal domain-containing protein [Halopseudomonas maritima]
MNHIFKTVFNAALGVWQAVSELARGCGKGRGQQGSGTQRSGQWRGAPGILLLLFAAPGSVLAASLPQNGQVIAGDVSISQPGEHTLTIEQGSNKAIIDWQSFSIGEGNTVNFDQNSSAAVALNRVTGNDPSAIYGNLNATGKVFLVNQNGVLFAEGANVNVGGLVASTLDIDNQDFVDGNYRFEGNGNQAVINRGAIQADGGAVVMLGGQVSNEGVIRANLGSVAMAAGEKIQLDFAGDGLINLTIEQGKLNALVQNHGAIQADGGSVYLTTHAADQVLDSVVNNSGQIRAQTVAERDGKIVLLADMQSGTATIDGTLDASAPASGDGGFIETSGAHVTIADSTQITTQAEHGETGTWLIDPNDFTVAASDGDITGATLSSQLASTSVEIQSVNGATDGNGDVFVNDSVSWNANTLTLNAERDIQVNASLNASGGAGLALKYGQGSSDGVINGSEAQYRVTAPINLASTGSFSTQLGSAGSVIDYTIITDVNALQAINSGLTGNYVLGADIDASATAGWNGGAGFEPLGSPSNSFRGVFDGLGHVISDLFIDRATDYVGLFGYADGAALRHVGLENVDITGSNYVGGLVAMLSAGSISQSYATGAVTGSIYVGGLVGHDQGGGISQSYATGAVTGTDRVGGLVGSHLGRSISQSYATGAVTGSSQVGGLVGYKERGSISQSYATGAVTGNNRVGGMIGLISVSSITNSYWNTETTGQSTSAGGTGLTTAQMFSADSFTGFEFGKVWGNAGDQTTPYLLRLSGNQVFNRHDLPTGAITASNRPDAYNVILTLQQLQAINSGLSGKYVLGADIDASASAGWNGGAGFEPLGGFSNRFGGVFDGLGHVISDLFIDRATDYVGLFGYTDGAALRQVGLENVDITGQRYVGGLVGNQYDGDIGNAYTTGVVTGGGNYVGGLVGLHWGGANISDAYSVSRVTGAGNFVGGLLGYQEGGHISDAYATGAVTGGKVVGGLVGGQRSGGSVSASYATGAVTGADRVGGLVGLQLSGSISNSHYLLTADRIIEATAGLVNTLGGVKVADNVSGATLSLKASGDVNVSDSVALEDNALLVEAGGDVDLAAGTALSSAAAGDALVLSSTAFTNNAGSDALQASHADGRWLIYSDNLDDNTFGGLASGNQALWNTSWTGSPGVTAAGNRYVFAMQPTLTVTGTVDGSKTYGDLHSFITPVAGTDYTLSGFVDAAGYGNVFTQDDASNIGAPTLVSAGAAANADVGDYAVTWQAGDLAATGYNVDLSATGGTLTVTSKVIDLINAIAQSKVYDGTTDADVTADLSGVISGDDLQLAVSGAFDDKNAGTGKTVTVSGVLSGADAGNYTLSGAANATADITAKVIDLINAVAQNKIYDGTTDADVTADLDGVISGDNLAVALNGAFDNKNAGTGKTVTVNGTLSGADAGNYTLSGAANATADITAKVIDLINAVAQNKTYDGTTDADVVADLSGVISGDDLAVALTGAFDNKNAGTGKTVTVNGTLSGADAGNYTLSASSISTTADITAKVIDLINAVAQNKIYDGTTDADVTADLSGVISGDDLQLAVSGAFDDKNAGTGKTVTVNGTLSGADAGNYALSASSISTTADITAKVIGLINAVAQNKIYDGTTDADVTADLDGVISGDDLAVALNGAFDNKHAGTGKTVTVNGTLSGADAGNYTLSGAANATADITAKVIDLINAVAQNKTYDGTTDADVVADLSGVISGDDLQLAVSGAFGDKNAGTGKTVTVNGALSGADAGNYTLSGAANATADITAKVIDLINAVAQNKTYDGTTDADVTADLSGVISGDDLQLAVSGAFDDKNAGTGKNVTVSGVLSGADAGNYTLSGAANATADITAKVIDLINAVAQNKIYDGTTGADVTADLSGVISGDDLQLAVSGAFDDKNAGTGKTVTVNGTLSGADAGNYALSASSISTTADITAKVIDLINAVAQNKTYDGTTDADVVADLSGVISGDDLQLAVSGAFDDKNAGTGKNVTVSGVLSGADAGNYTLSASSISTTADITAKVIDLINAVAQHKLYDGTADADVTAGLRGVVSGDDLQLAVSGAFDDKNAGTGKNVTVSGVLSGADAGNYTLSASSISTTADITAKVIDLINAVAQHKVYDGTADADVGAELSGVINGDDLSVTLSGLFANAEVGRNKLVTVTGELHGADRSNYQLSGPVETFASVLEDVTTMGYEEAIRLGQKTPMSLPGETSLQLTVRGDGLNLTGLAGDVTLETTDGSNDNESGYQGSATSSLQP